MKYQSPLGNAVRAKVGKPYDPRRAVLNAEAASRQSLIDGDLEAMADYDRKADRHRARLRTVDKEPVDERYVALFGKRDTIGNMVKHQHISQQFGDTVLWLRAWAACEHWSVSGFKVEVVQGGTQHGPEGKCDKSNQGARAYYAGCQALPSDKHAMYVWKIILGQSTPNREAANWGGRQQDTRNKFKIWIYDFIEAASAEYG